METPILFLLFNRPETTYKVFSVIRKVKPKKLFIAADGPRNDNEKILCEKTRSIVDKIDWPCEVYTLFREGNLGCRKAISEALNWFFESVEYGIVLEDDCVPDISFFGYCTFLLEKYKHDTKITMISGSNHLLSSDIAMIDGYFYSNYCNIWGWASWNRVIRNVNWFPNELEVNVSIGDFRNYVGDRFRFTDEIKKLLYEVIRGEYDTWDTILFYNLYLMKGTNIFPTKNMITNIGINGTHAHGDDADLTLFRATQTMNIDKLYPICSSYETNTTVNRLMLENIEKVISPKQSRLRQFFNRVRFYLK